MSRPGFYFFICPDAALIQKRVQDLLAAHAPPAGGMLGSAPAAWEIVTYWGDEGLPEQFWKDLTLTDLFGRPKALVVRNAQNLDKEQWEQLSAPLSRFNAHAWPLLCLENPYERGKAKIPAVVTGSAFYKFAQKRNWMWQSPGLGDQGIRNWLQSWARDKGFSFAPGALEALTEGMPPDAAAVAGELEKLELASQPGAQLTVEAAELLNHVPDIDIFAFIDALQNNRSGARIWQKVLMHQLAGKGFLFQFLAMLLREARILWQLAHQESGVKLPARVAQNKQRVAQQLGGRRIARIWDVAMEAELRVKSGEAGEDQAMEMLIADLSRLFCGSVAQSAPTYARRPRANAR